MLTNQCAIWLCDFFVLWCRQQKFSAVYSSSLEWLMSTKGSIYWSMCDLNFYLIVLQLAMFDFFFYRTFFTSVIWTFFWKNFINANSIVYWYVIKTSLFCDFLKWYSVLRMQVVCSFICKLNVFFFYFHYIAKCTCIANSKDVFWY